jgi:hypothetical protein
MVAPVTTDFFTMPEADVMRGTGGSPLLVPKGLEGKGIRSEYTRASYMADFLEDKSHIHKWEMRYLAKAMGQNEDLAALAACEVYSTGISDAVQGREKTQSGRNLDQIIERAFDRVRLHEKADRGTTIHGFTEPGAPTGSAIPERLRNPVAAFWEINRRECIELVGTEQFTANDVTMSAGTFDHLVRIPGHPLLKGLVIGDKKTGSFDPFSWCIQLSTYAYGDPYNTADDTRPAWPGMINLDYGLVWQIDAVSAQVKLWIIDLAIGWELAKVAAKSRDAHKRNDIAVEYKAPPFIARLEASNTRDDLTRLWKSINPDDHNAANKRLAVEQKARSL